MFFDGFPGIILLIILLIFFFPIFVLDRLWKLKKELTELKNWQTAQNPVIAALQYEIAELKQRLIPRVTGTVADEPIRTVAQETASASARVRSEHTAVPVLQYDFDLALSPVSNLQVPEQNVRIPLTNMPNISPALSETSPQPESVSHPPTVKQPVSAVKQREFESLLGANWLAKLGVAAIAVAVAFFLQYAFRSGLIGPAAQVAIGLCGSAIMLGGGQYLLKKEPYQSYAQVLASGGIIIFFLSIYAAYGFYHPPLLGYAPAFAALTIGALAASILALVNGTEVVAILCILGAFAAPVLIRESGTGAPNPDSLLRLYAYVALLNLWVVGLLRFRAWHSLSVVAFASTWLLFYSAGSLQDSGWATEGFATLFLLFSCYQGVRGMYAPRTPSSGEEQQGLADSAKAGLVLIVGGCAAFALASAMILNGIDTLGMPDVSLAGILIALILSGLAAMLPTLSHSDREIRLSLGYFSTCALILVLGASIGSSPPPTGDDIPIAFGFTLFNFVLFTAMSLVLHRRQEQENAAAILCAGNVLIHIVMAHHVLQTLAFWEIPVVSLWMPLASWLLMGGLWIVGRQHKEAFVLRRTLIIAAQILPLYGLFALQEQFSSPIGAFLFAGEFVLVSTTWIAFRENLALPSFRSNLLVALGNAAIFFCLIARMTGTETYLGSPFVMLAGWAIVMAAYHFYIGGTVLRKPSDSRLHQLIYMGLGLTFVSIAIPLQLRASYITLAWAIQATFLVWIGKAGRERRASLYGVILLAVAAVKALCFDLLTSPVHFYFLLNTRMLAGAAVIVGAYVSAWLLWQDRDKLSSEERLMPAGLGILANVLTLLFVSVDLWEYMGHQFPLAGQVSAQHLALSIYWTVYALIGVSVGIWKRLRAVRLFAMGLLYLSIVKVFLFDLSSLEPLYRIISFFTLGVILLLVSYLYTRFEGRLSSGTED